MRKWLVVFGRTLVKSGELTELKKEREYVQQMQTSYANRPALDKVMTREEHGAVLQVYPFSPVALYGMAQHIDALRIVLERLRYEIFRNGLDIVERYSYKCLNAKCGKEFQSLPQNEDTGETECDTCHQNKLARPLPKNRQTLLKLLEKPVNKNYQTLKDVLFQIEWDLDVFDNGYLLLLKDYTIGSDGNIADREIVEILRADAQQLFYVADSQGKIGYEDAIGSESNGKPQQSKPILVCPRPEHRMRKIPSNSSDASGKCPDCGANGVMAVMVVKSIMGIPRGSTVPEVYYIEGEVIFGSKYQPSLLYGYSPIYALWMKVMTLFYQDRYMMTYYDKMRTPRGIFAVATKSLASFQKAWELLKKWAEDDPHQIHPLAVETDKAGRSIVQFVDLMRNLEEMQYTEVRDEYRRTIGSIYGIMGLFQGDQGTGWSNEGLQMTVQTRSIKAGQETITEKFLDKLLQRIGIADWRIVFKPSEDMDKLRDLQIAAQELANAEALQRMRFKIWFDHTGRLKHSKVPAPEPVNPMMGEGLENGGMSDKKPNAAQSEQGRFQGEPKLAKPSDVGGMAQGHPASGEGTSLSMKNASDEDGVIDMIGKNLKSDSDFANIDILKSIDSMKLDASRQSWQYDYVDVGKPMEKDIRRYVQLMFTANQKRKTAVSNLVTIGLPEAQAELIVRTEFNMMLNRAREFAYKESDPEGDKFGYYWKVSGDSKVCQVCYEIAKRSAKGVSMEELKAIIKSVATEFGVTGARRMWHSHPGDRCMVNRVKP